MADRALRHDDAGFWRALPWAVLCWLLAVWSIGHFLTQKRVETTVPQTVEERIVELPDTPPATRREDTPPPPKQPLPPPPVPQPQLAEPVPAPAAAKPQPPSPPMPAAAPPPVAVAAKAVAGVETHGVQAINQQRPQIPDALADEASGLTVTAVFTVAADGSFTVELSGAQDPVLKNSILRTLKKWTFRPAMKADNPVAGTMSVDFAF